MAARFGCLGHTAGSGLTGALPRDRPPASGQPGERARRNILQGGPLCGQVSQGSIVALAHDLFPR